MFHNQLSILHSLKNNMIFLIIFNTMINMMLIFIGKWFNYKKIKPNVSMVSRKLINN